MTAMEQSHSACFFQVAHFMTKQDTQNPIRYNSTPNIHRLVMVKHRIPVNSEACKSNSGLDQDCLILRFVGYVTWYWVCNTKPVPKNPRLCCSSSSVLLNILVRCGLIAAETKIGRQSHIFIPCTDITNKKCSRSAAASSHTSDLWLRGAWWYDFMLKSAEMQLLKVEREVFSPMDRHLQETTLS